MQAAVSATYNVGFYASCGCADVHTVEYMSSLHTFPNLQRACHKRCRTTIIRLKPGMQAY